MEDNKELMTGLYKLVLAYLLDQRCGQITIPLKDLNHTDSTVRLAFMPDETVVVTLISKEQAQEMIDSGVKHIKI